MDQCELCGIGMAEGMEYVDAEGHKHSLCGRCGPSAREYPGALTQATGFPICDACGQRHSDRCSLVDYAGENFNVCGECVPQVVENPADFLAGKRGTEPEA
jgi:ribosome-binding protein aMBF1 (putative translation factor)